MKIIKPIIVLIISLAFIAMGVFGLKSFNYHFFYKDKVKETIMEIVKPEALK